MSTSIFDQAMQEVIDDLTDNAGSFGNVNKDDWAKVILPIIKKTLPSMIAQDIVGVQPMTGPAGSIFTMGAKSKMSAQDASSYDEWLQKTGRDDCAESVKIYIEELVQ